MCIRDRDQDLQRRPRLRHDRIGAGAGGRDRIKEIKVFSSLKKSRRAGKGGKQYGGCPASVGHLYAFGNTEEEARVRNLGAKGRGREVDGELNHKTGKGWVAQRDGCYVDALTNKKNEVEIIIHEPLGGGFSPPALAALHRNSKTARAGTDRTKYTCPRPISYMTHHAQRISLGIVRAEARAYLDALARRKSDLVRIIGVMRAHS